jgi:nucleotide-binding universal stress UspA family protein
MMIKIVLGFDESKGAVSAAEYIKRLNIGSVLAVIVFPSNLKLPLTLNTFTGPKVFESITDLLAEFKNILENIYSGKNISVEVKNIYTTASNPAVDLIKIANEEHADLIVSGSRGLGKIGALFLGSVSNYLIQNSNIPVLVVTSK